jgi:hypothetical protein
MRAAVSNPARNKMNSGARIAASTTAFPASFPLFALALGDRRARLVGPVIADQW